MNRKAPRFGRGAFLLCKGKTGPHFLPGHCGGRMAMADCWVTERAPKACKSGFKSESLLSLSNTNTYVLLKALYLPIGLKLKIPPASAGGAVVQGKKRLCRAGRFGDSMPAGLFPEIRPPPESQSRFSALAAARRRPCRAHGYLKRSLGVILK